MANSFSNRCQYEYYSYNIPWASNNQEHVYEQYFDSCLRSGSHTLRSIQEQQLVSVGTMGQNISSAADHQPPSGTQTSDSHLGDGNNTVPHHVSSIPDHKTSSLDDNVQPPEKKNPSIQNWTPPPVDDTPFASQLQLIDERIQICREARNQRPWGLMPYRPVGNRYNNDRMERTRYTRRPALQGAARAQAGEFHRSLFLGVKQQQRYQPARPVNRYETLNSGSPTSSSSRSSDDLPYIRVRRKVGVLDRNWSMEEEFKKLEVRKGRCGGGRDGGYGGGDLDGRGSPLEGGGGRVQLGARE
ncbi:hypothetical protein F5884DRAFT_746863 [Xylogone sp. PMI_703]|nr:hypothetical protein F5884DRAFT_746863 [Xylogone sp. PMI_703]